MSSVHKNKRKCFCGDDDIVEGDTHCCGPSPLTRRSAFTDQTILNFFEIFDQNSNKGEDTPTMSSVQNNTDDLPKTHCPRKDDNESLEGSQYCSVLTTEGLHEYVEGIKRCSGPVTLNRSDSVYNTVNLNFVEKLEKFDPDPLCKSTHEPTPEQVEKNVKEMQGWKRQQQQWKREERWETQQQQPRREELFGQQ